MIGMMYVSAYPVAVVLRSTNEEQKTERQHAGYQLRRLLLQDTFWAIFPWYLVCYHYHYDCGTTSWNAQQIGYCAHKIGSPSGLRG